MAKINLKKLGWAIVAGIFFGFIIALLTGNGELSLSFALLVAYLQYKL